MLTAYKKELHERAILIGREFKRVETDVIQILQKVEETKVFLDVNKSSLHRYAVDVMGLSDSVASNYILSARKCTLIPVLQEAVREGSVSVSNVRKAASVLTLENKEEWPVWIDKMKTLSSGKLEREVAKANPRAAVPEKIRYVSEDRLELQTGITQEMSEQIKRIRDLESKRTSKSANIEDALKASCLETHESGGTVRKESDPGSGKTSSSHPRSRSVRSHRRWQERPLCREFNDFMFCSPQDGS